MADDSSMWNTMTISAYGMKAQSERSRVISENIANAGTAALTPEGQPYTRKIITFKRGAYWWSSSEGAYPLSAALETIKENGGWVETIPNPNYRPKGLFG